MSSKLSPSKISRRAAYSFRLLALLSLLAIPAWPAVTKATDQISTPKGILVLYYYGKDYPANVEFEEGVLSALKSTPPGSFEYYPEYLEPNRFPGKLQSEAFQDYLRKKYADHRIDVVIAQTDIALGFLMQYRRDLFPNSPIVFFARKGPDLNIQPGEPGYTGIVADHAYQQTLDLALTLHPRTQRVYVVTGTPENDPTLETIVQEQLRPFESRLDVVYLTNLPLDEMLAQVRKAGQGSLILYVRYSQDEPGKTLGPREILALVAQSSKVPIYGIAEGFVGHGIVGGYLFRQQEAGKRLGEMSVQIANGARTADVPTEKARLVPMFDWRQLRQWNISESRLPAGSVISFKDPTLWEQYKWRIVGVISLIVVQALGIVWLLFTQSKLRQAEKRSTSFALLAESEHKRLEEVVSNVPGVVWEAWFEPGTTRLNTKFVSPYVEQMLGYSVEEWLATPDFRLSIVHEDDREEARRSVAAILAGGSEHINQFRYVTKDGRIVWGEAHLVPVHDEAGKIVGLRGVTMNITDRRLAEAAVLERKQELSEAQRLAKVGSWEWDPATDTVTWSEEMFRIIGRDPSLSAANYAEHPALYTRASWALLKSSVDRALSQGTPYELELQVIRGDGQLIWTSARGEVLKDETGRVLKLRGTLQDIAQRKQAEADLQRAIAEVNKLKNQLQEENIYLQEEIKLAHNFTEIVGRSDATKYVLFKIEQVAPTDTTVLITGETGTGKELVAHAIHGASTRRERPLVKVNCAALSPTLIESELFGHEKGAFTGATARKIGRFELANAATIFLDEIGELPLELQVKLLRVIQEGEFERLGSSKTIKVDVRIIAATNRNLKNAVEQGGFREDLWYRLNVFPITVPPLRDRKEDIPGLVEHFVRRFSQKVGKGIFSIPPASLRILQDYSWPGNVRELANVLERAVINTSGAVLRIVDHFEKPHTDGLPQADKTLEEMEKEYIIRILESTGWRIEGRRGAARILGLNPSTLRTRMSKLGIQKADQSSTMASAAR